MVPGPTYYAESRIALRRKRRYLREGRARALFFVRDDVQDRKAAFDWTDQHARLGVRFRNESVIELLPRDAARPFPPGRALRAALPELRKKSASRPYGDDPFCNPIGEAKQLFDPLHA
jgi:hypothetical protein